MDDHDPPHTIPQADTPMSPDGEERRGAAVLSSSSSSSSSSGLASSVGSSSSSGFPNPKISPSGSSCSNFGGGDAEDVKALRDANASATHLPGRVISESDLASAATNDTEEHHHDDAPNNSLLDGMKRRYPESTAAAASTRTPIGTGGAMRIRTGKRRGRESLAVQTAITAATTTDVTMAEPNSTPDLQSELVSNLLSHRNSHRNGNSHHSPTVQFSFLDEEAMPARASDEPVSSRGGGNVLQRACQVLIRGGSSGNKHSAPSTAAAFCQPQSPAKIRTKGLQSTKTKRGGRRLSDSATLVTTGKRQPQGRQGKRLSLSEYRKADESSAVRLTDADPNQCIHTAYDLTESPQCRILGHGSSSTVRLAVRRSDATLVAIKCLSKFEIMSSRRAGGGRESTRTSPVRQHQRRPLGPLLGGGGRRSHRRLDECEVLRALDGVPNVTHLLDVYEDDDEVQLVLEYCPGGELFDAIHRRRQLAAAAAQDCGGKRSSRSKSVGPGYTEREAAVIVGQLLEALAALHERGIVHRDVKPENVFLMSTTSTTSNDANANDLEVRLSDFGLARYLHRPSHQRVDADAADDASSSSSTASSSASGGESPITPPSVLRAQRGRAYSSVGSDYYAAPEVENGSGYDTQCDVYSLGVTLYILLGGFPPRQRKQRAGSLDAYDAMLSMLESRTSSSSEGDSSSSSSGEEDDADETNPISVTFPGSHWKHASSGAKDLIRQMMHSDPNARITARDALQHEWIVQHFKAAAAATTAEEQPSRAPGQKKRSSLVLSSASIAPCADRPNFRRKLSNLNLCDMASDEGTPDPSPVSNTAAVPPTVAAAMPPPMSFGQAAFSMAELYNRMSLVADATTDEVNVDEDIVEDEGMDDNAASTPERAVTTTATVPLSV